MARNTQLHRRPGRRSAPTRLSDEVLRNFGGMSEAWCQLVHNEGNVGQMTIVAGDNTLPLVVRPNGTPLDFLRRGLILGRGLPERSVTVVIGASTIGRLGISGLLYTANLIDAFPAIDLRITPPELQLTHSFTLFDQPPTGEPRAAFAQPNGELQRFTGDKLVPYQQAAELALGVAAPHQNSLVYMYDLAVSTMITKPVLE